MSKVFNMVGGGGGKNISAIIITGLESTDTVTCTKDGKSYTTAWDSTDQHWEIVGLPLGTFTVTATNGTKSITETVLIDIVGVYEIEMSFILWLYRDGDECEDVTGGFDTSVVTNSVFSLVKNSSNISTNLSTTVWGWGSAITSNGVDIKNYTKLKIEYTINNNSRRPFGVQFAICNNADIQSWDDFNNSRNAYVAAYCNTTSGGTIAYENSKWGNNLDVSVGTHVLEKDITDYIGLYKIAIGAVAYTQFNVSKIWLEV